MPKQTNLRTNGITFGRDVETHDPCVAARQRHEARAQTQERGLAGTVGALDEENLTALDVERSLGKCGERTE